MARIFISYRRNPDREFVGRLASKLREKIPGSVFFDEKLSPGDDWSNELLHRIRTSELFLPVFGQGWRGEFDRRATDGKDYFRAEIVEALRETEVRTLTIMPLLIDQSISSEDLPEDLQQLARRHYLHIKPNDPNCFEAVAVKIQDWWKRKESHRRLTFFYERLCEHLPPTQGFQGVIRQLGISSPSVECGLNSVEWWVSLGDRVDVGEVRLREAVRAQAATTSDALAADVDHISWTPTTIVEEVASRLPDELKPLGPLSNDFDRLLELLPPLAVAEFCLPEHEWRDEAVNQCQKFQAPDRDLIRRSALFAGKKFRAPAMFAALAAQALAHKCMKNPLRGKELIEAWLQQIIETSPASRFVLELLLEFWPQREWLNQHLASAVTRIDKVLGPERKKALIRLLYLERIAQARGWDHGGDVPKFVRGALRFGFCTFLPEWLALFGERRLRVHLECLAHVDDDATRGALAREMRRVHSPDAIPPQRQMPAGLWAALTTIAADTEDELLLEDRLAREWWLRILPFPASSKQLSHLVQIAFGADPRADSNTSERAREWLNAQPELEPVWRALGKQYQERWVMSLSEKFCAAPEFRTFIDSLRERGEAVDISLLSAPNALPKTLL